MISFKNYKDVDSKHGWRNCGIGGCKKQIYGFGRLRRILDDFEGTRIGMRKLRKAYYCDEERAWYGRGPDYNMETQFLISCIGMNVDDAFSKFKKLVKKYKAHFSYNYRYSAKGWFSREILNDYRNREFYIDPDRIIRYRVSFNYNIYRYFKPRRVGKKYIEENRENAKEIKLKDGITYLGKFWVILLDSNTLYPEKVPVYAIRMNKYRNFEKKKKFQSINDFFQQIYVVGYGTEDFKSPRYPWNNRITTAIFVTKKLCLKKFVVK